MPFQKGHKLAKGGRREGAGRKTNKIRAACRESFAKRIKIANEIADNKEERATDRIAALALLARVGVPAQHEHDVDGSLFEGAEVIIPGLKR